MVKKLVLPLVVIMLVIGLALSGCAQQAPAPSSVPKPSPAPATAPALSQTPASAKPIELKFSTHIAETASIGNVYKGWAKRIEEQSGGRLMVKLYFSSVLIGTEDIPRGLQTGMVDIAHYTIGTNPRLLPMMEMARLPFLGLPAMKNGVDIIRKLMEDSPEIQQEAQSKKLMYVGFLAYPPEQFMFTKKVIRTPEELRGIKIIARGYWPQVLQSVGAACLNLGAEDRYTGLERGLVEGHVINFLGAYTAKTLELLKYHTILGDAGASVATGALMMNVDLFNSLPPDLQKVLLENCRWFENEQIKADGGDEQKGLDAAKAANHTFTYLNADEIQKWYALAKPVHETYLADNASAGPIKAVYDKLQQIIKQSR